MKKAIWNIFIVVYAIIAIFITICLLSYNEYKITEFGDWSLVIIDNRELEPDFIKGDIVITDRSYGFEEGQQVFFYKKAFGEVTINIAKITEKQEYTNGEVTYVLEGDNIVKEKNILGNLDTAKTIKKAGTILGILESKWGFLVLIVLPSLIAFLYEIGELISDIRTSSNKKEKNEK